MDDSTDDHSLADLDYETDVTPEGVAEMRGRAASKIEGQDWVVIDAAAERLKRMGLERAP